MKWTAAQKQTIESDSSEITVAASAGTGKTTVLSQRCVRLLSDADLCPDVSGIVVLTFTDAAAGEMNNRIAQRLKDAAFEKNNPHLRKQLLMLDDADISTIHSFCRRTIGQHFHRLGLEPSLRLMDADESKLIKAEILDEIVEQAWNDAALSAGLEMLLKERPVSGKANFLNCIMDISELLDSLVSADTFFERAAVLNDAFLNSSSDAGRRQKEIIFDKLNIFSQQLQWSLKLDSKISAGHWAEYIKTELMPIVAWAAELLKKDDLKDFVKYLNNLDIPKWPNKPRGFDDDKKIIVQAPARAAIDGLKKLLSLALLDKDYESLVASDCSVQIKVVVELVKMFDRAYLNKKKQLGCLDFADLERYMLKLLTEEGDLEKQSDIAGQLAEKYKYIFVDEYQDINPVQQRIIDLLSGSAKVFVVGDVKQSIYAWRGADCGSFVQRLKDCDTDESKSRIDLNENFRSQPQILKFVNEVFKKIMTSSVAAIDYDQKAALKAFNNEQKQQSNSAVELIVVDDQKADEEDTLENNNGSNEELSFSDDATNRRAIAVACCINELVNIEKFQVYDKENDTYRSCEYRDIVILMRAFGSRANNYVQLLRYANIPVISDSSAGYFEATEIKDILSLLMVLDNPKQDIPLASVLRSPIFGVSDTEFAVIKSCQKQQQDFFSLIETIATDCVDKNLQKKISVILFTIDTWRSKARVGSLADLIWQIYSETGYLTFVSALAGGTQRRANLLKLHQRAIQFENFASSFNCVSLSRFVNFLQKLLEAGGDWAPAEPDSSAVNAVRVMSVHKSKGLEFPVVILAETNRRFGSGGYSSDLMADGEETIGLKIIEHEHGIKLPSMMWQVVNEKQKSQTLAEEMRILYVAMTRAKDKLIITGSAKSKECVRLLTNAAVADSEKLDDWLIRSANSELDWLIMALAKNSALSSYFKLPLEMPSNNHGLFDLKVYQTDEIELMEKQLLQKQSESIYQQIKKPLADNDLAEQIKANLQWQYRFKGAAALKAKQTVTSLLQTEEYAGANLDYSFEPFAKTDGHISRLVIGSATHLVLQNIDLTAAVDSAVINKTIETLKENGSFTSRIAEKIDTNSIEKFFADPLGKAALDSKNTVMREWPFTYAVSAKQLYPQIKHAADEKIIVQGIIDMLIKTPDGLVVIDFKTDYVTDENLQQKAAGYTEQLKWYCKAASQIVGVPIKSGSLYFLSVGKQVNIC